MCRVVSYGIVWYYVVLYCIVYLSTNSAPSTEFAAR